MRCPVFFGFSTIRSLAVIALFWGHSFQMMAQPAEHFMTIKMTSVFVPNPSEAFKFYTETLGFDSLMHIPEYQIAIVVSKSDPTGTSLLLEPNGNPIAKTYQEAIYEQGLPCIVFGTEDMDTEYKRLTSLGVKFKQEPTKTDWGTIAIFEDGFGNYIQIHQD